jgi:acyl dehydratase
MAGENGRPGLGIMPRSYPDGPSHSGERSGRLHVLRRLPGWRSHRKPDSAIAEIDRGLFIALTGGGHSGHTDAQAAKRTAFGERIAHGLLLLAVERGTGRSERLLDPKAMLRGGPCDV